MRESGREKEKTSGKGKGKEDGKVEEVRKAVVMMVGKLAVYFPFGGHVGVNGRGVSFAIVKSDLVTFTHYFCLFFDSPTPKRRISSTASLYLTRTLSFSFQPDQALSGRVSNQTILEPSNSTFERASMPSPLGLDPVPAARKISSWNKSQIGYAGYSK